ncbi:MAG: hypothetical protein ABMA02_09905 [Saprospiraceae bacterium]
MKTAQDFLNQVRQHIGSDETAEAIRLLQNLLEKSPKLSEVLLQSARLADIARQVRLGLVEDKQAALVKNQIRAGLLELVDEIEAKETAIPEVREEIARVAASVTIVQNAEKIYNIEKIDNANFS